MPGQNGLFGLGCQHCVDIFDLYSSLAYASPIGGLGHVRFRPENVRCLHHRLFKRFVLKRVESVVVDENADGALCRQQVSGVADQVRDVLQAVCGGLGSRIVTA